MILAIELLPFFCKGKIKILNRCNTGFCNNNNDTALYGAARMAFEL